MNQYNLTSQLRSGRVARPLVEILNRQIHSKHFMRKILFSTAITACFWTHSFGQVNFGYKAGLNVSNISNSSHNEFTSNLNFNTGASAKFKLDKNYFINIECLLSLKGFNSLLIPDGTTATTLSYLTLPVLFEYAAPSKFYFQLGPELNYLIAAKMKNNIVDKSVADSYKKIDITLAGGLGYNISKKIGLETRYIFGLSQLNENPDIFGSEYNRNLQINIIYWFK
jgi:hypothetical protein